MIRRVDHTRTLSTGSLRRAAERALVLMLAAIPAACDTPETDVVLDNRYPPAATNALVVYEARWHAVSFASPVLPGASSDPESAAAASPNTAYVVLAPGWDPASSSPPTSFVVMRSRSGFDVHLNATRHIPVDDTTFIGNCAAGSVLSRDDADFITQRIFPSTFSALRYDPASCTTTPIPDAGGS